MSIVRLIVLLVGLFLHGADAGAVLEDHTPSWIAAGLGDTLATGIETALPAPLFQALAAAVPRLQKEVADSSTERYKFGKRNTWWMPLASDAGPPRSAIEAAIRTLHALDFGDRANPISGAEWWFQEGGPADNIGYHYDKDEAFASDEMMMRFPEVSTVTYLTEIGAPTLILNQTTPDGNEEIPPTPELGLLVHPAPNKHLVFRGNLHHGVSADLSRWAAGGEAAHRTAAAGGRRFTFLVNFWRRMPKPPNCVVFGEERWRRLGLWLEPQQATALMAFPTTSSGGGSGGGGSIVAAPRQPLEWAPLAIDAAEETRQVAVTLPVTDLVYFRFPTVERMKPGNFRVEWVGESTAVGPITRLDLNHRRSLDAIFNDRRPKLFLVFPNRGKPLWQGTLPKWIRSLHEKFSANLRFVLAEPSETGDFMRQFGLTAADAPTVVIHDNNGGRDKKYRLKKDAKQLRKAAVVDFVQRVLDGGSAKDEL